MSDSIKKQIIARVVEICETLKSDPELPLRVVARVNTLFSLEQQRPALHIVIGHETPSHPEESFDLYTAEFPIFLKLMFTAGTEYYQRADDYEAVLTKKIEADIQLLGGGTALCKRLQPDGVVPFLDEQQKPDGGLIMTWIAEYRRVKGDPYTRR